MRFTLRLALILLPLLLFVAVPAQAHEVEVVTNLICDTQEQVERFVALLYDGDAQAAISAVNAAEHNPTACGMATAAFVRGPQLATARNKDTTFNIVRLFVVAVVTEAGVESVTPAAFFSLIPIEEIPVAGRACRCETTRP
jgi:hypothetical protein